MFDTIRAHIDNPLFVFVIAFFGQSLAAYAGDFLRKRTPQLRQDEHERHDFDTVRATTMTLLALIIGFSFSMAFHATISAKRSRGGGKCHRYGIFACGSPAG
jgi:hypothetical protein